MQASSAAEMKSGSTAAQSSKFSYKKKDNSFGSKNAPKKEAEKSRFFGFAEVNKDNKQGRINLQGQEAILGDNKSVLPFQSENLPYSDLIENFPSLMPLKENNVTQVSEGFIIFPPSKDTDDTNGGEFFFCNPPEDAYDVQVPEAIDFKYARSLSIYEENATDDNLITESQTIPDADITQKDKANIKPKKDQDMDKPQEDSGAFEDNEIDIPQIDQEDSTIKEDNAKTEAVISKREEIIKSEPEINCSRPTRQKLLQTMKFPQCMRYFPLLSINSPTRIKPIVDEFRDTSEFMIEKIIGCSIDSCRHVKYYVKFVDVAFRHCQWLDAKEIISRGAENVLKEFKNARRKIPLSRSICIPNLLVLSNIELDPQWYNLEKIIDESYDEGRFEYLVKWRGIEHNLSTWEPASTIRTEREVDRYVSSLSSYNSKIISSRWKRPTLDLYVPVQSIDYSGTGLQLNEAMQKCVNEIAQSYYKGKNIIHADTSTYYQRQQIAAALHYLTDLTKFNGPILILTISSDLQIWKDEFDDWTGFNSVVFRGSKESLKILFEGEINVVNQEGRILVNKIQADVIICSFELFKENIIQFLDIQWRVFVLDATHFSNFQESCLNNIQTEHTILTVSKPVLPDVSLFWNHLHFIAPEVFSDKDEFFTKFHTTNAHSNGDLWNVVSPYVSEQLQAIEDEVQFILVEPSMQQISLAKKILVDFQSVYKDPLPDNIYSLYYMFSLLRLISNHPFLVNFDKYSQRSLIDSSGKFLFLERLLKSTTNESEKTLIFSEIPDQLNLVEALLDNLKIKFMRSTSICSDDEYNNTLDIFSESNEYFVFLYNSHIGARKIDTSVFSIIVILDDDTYKLHACPETIVYRLITRGFPEQYLYSHNLCYDETAVYSASSDGPFPCPFDQMSNVLNSTLIQLSEMQNFGASASLKKPFIALAKNSFSIESTSKLIEYLTQNPKCENLSEIIKSIQDIGMRNLPTACSLVHLASHHQLNQPEFHIKLLNPIIKHFQPYNPENQEEAELIQSYADDIVHDACFFIRVQRALAGFSFEIDFPDIGGSTISDDYALLYNIFLGGITWTINLINSKKLSCPAKTTDGIINRVESILDIFDQSFDGDEPDLNGYTPISVEKWAKQYPDLHEIQKSVNKSLKKQSMGEEKQNKEGEKASKITPESTLFDMIWVKSNNLTKPEVIYNALVEHGIPHHFSPSNAWDALIYKCNLKLSAAGAQEIGDEHINFAIRVNNQGSDINIPKSSILSNFAEKYTLKDAKQLLNSIHAMSTITSINNQFKSIPRDAYNQLSSNQGFPAWWTGDHSRMLLTAISRFGSFSFFSWIILPAYLCVSQIPANLLASFTQASQLEKKGKLTESTIPADLGDFALLFQRSFRLSKALSIVQELNQIMISKCQSDNQSAFPIKPSESLQIISLGQVSKIPVFNGPYCPYPIGFISERRVTSISGNPIWFRCEIHEVAGKPFFSVFLKSDPLSSWYGLTLSQVGSFICQKYNISTPFGGLWLYGLVHPKVFASFQKNSNPEKWKSIPPQFSNDIGSDQPFLLPFE